MRPSAILLLVVSLLPVFTNADKVSDFQFRDGARAVDSKGNYPLVEKGTMTFPIIDPKPIIGDSAVNGFGVSDNFSLLTSLFDYLAVTGACTWSTTVYIESNTNPGGKIPVSFSAGAGRRNFIQITDNGLAWRFNVRVSTAGGHDQAVNLGNYWEGRWVRIYIACDNSGWAVYGQDVVSGHVDTLHTSAVVPSITGMTEASIGRLADNTGSEFINTIGRVEFWDEKLDATSIAALDRSDEVNHHLAMFMGDSITKGTATVCGTDCCSHGGNGYRWRWNDLSFATVDGPFVYCAGPTSQGDMFVPLHDGISGNVAADINSRFDARLDSYFPFPSTKTAVFVMVGTNDAILSTDLNTFEATQDDTIAKADAHDGDFPFFMVAPPLNNSGFDVSPYNARTRISVANAQAAGKNVKLIDLELEPVGTCSDNLHPAGDDPNAGYDLIGQLLFEAYVASIPSADTVEDGLGFGFGFGFN